VTTLPKPWAQSLASLSLYEALLTVALAAGWLLPNHYPPWLAFHSNAWVAAVLLLCAMRALSTTDGAVHISRASAFLLVLALVPCIQFWFGMVHQPSRALLSFLYLLGLAAAFIVGEHWSRAGQDKPPR